MFKNKITKNDISSILKFFIAIPFALFLKRKKIWLFSERPREAKDNAYVLFKYINEHTKKNNIYYVIEKDSLDISKLDKYNNVIDYNSFIHYVIYLAAYLHISAHVDLDSPNSRVSNFLETHGLLNNKRVFLQHGITKDRISFGYYSVCRADLFICGAKKNMTFVEKNSDFQKGMYNY